jgi:hypothetical protein
VTSPIRRVGLVCVVAVGLVWLGHACLKISTGVGEGTTYAAFVGDRAWLHWVWVGCEAGLGLWLLSRRATRTGLLTSMFLLATLSGLILAERQPRPCGCAWSQQAADREPARASMRWSLGRNAVLLAVSFVALVVLSRSETPDSAEGSQSEPGLG